VGLLSLRRARPPVLKPQEIVDLTLPPTVIFGCERVDAGINADVTNKKLGALDQMRHLISGSSAKATRGGSHDSAPCFPTAKDRARD
jgi:hypothetical protein